MESLYRQLLRNVSSGPRGEDEVLGELAPAVEGLGLKPHLVLSVGLQGKEDVACRLSVCSLTDG